MTFLILSIALSSLLFVGFKWFDIKKINLLVAIIGNYISCIITGLILNSTYKQQEPVDLQAYDLSIVGICMALGCLFFIIFYAMGYASARIGVGITSASTKMSLIIPVLYGTLILGEELGITRIFALIAALTAVVLMSWKRGEKPGATQFMIPFFIFIGSGIVDTSINLLRMELDKRQLDNETGITWIFTGALCFSLLVLFFKNRQLIKDFRSLGFGLLLGIPNYLSIYVMMKALGSGVFSSNQFYMLNNTGIMALCFMLGLLLFKEKINLPKGIGLVLSIISIYLILYC